MAEILGEYVLYGKLVSHEKAFRLMEHGWHRENDSRTFVFQIPEGIKGMKKHAHQWFFGVGDLQMFTGNQLSAIKDTDRFFSEDRPQVVRVETPEGIIEQVVMMNFLFDQREKNDYVDNTVEELYNIAAQEFDLEGAATIWHIPAVSENMFFMEDEESFFMEDEESDEESDE